MTGRSCKTLKVLFFQNFFHIYSSSVVKFQKKKQKKAHISYGLFSKSSNTKQGLCWRNRSNLNQICFLSSISCCIRFTFTRWILFISNLLIPQESMFLLLLVSSSWSQDLVKEPDRENAEFVATSFQMLSCTNTTESHFYNMLMQPKCLAT